MKRVGMGCLVVVAVLAVAAVATGWFLHRPLPEGRGGKAADELARRMQRAVHIRDWERTGAVQWTFAGRHDLLWDRERRFARVSWDKTEVLLRLSDRSGRALVRGTEQRGEKRRELLDEAYAAFINDAFWLNPMRTFFDEGVERRVVEHEPQQEALLVTYTTGGVTPGDSYLFIPDSDGMPERWRMWVSILPIGGLATTWERWETLDTGARIATLHQAGPLSLELTDVRGAETLEALVGPEDPFRTLE